MRSGLKKQRAVKSVVFTCFAAVGLLAVVYLWLSISPSSTFTERVLLTLWALLGIGMSALSLEFAHASLARGKNHMIAGVISFSASIAILGSVVYFYQQLLPSLERFDHFYQDDHYKSQGLAEKILGQLVLDETKPPTPSSHFDTGHFLYRLEKNLAEIKRQKGETWTEELDPEVEKRVRSWLAKELRECIDHDLGCSLNRPLLEAADSFDELDDELYAYFEDHWDKHLTAKERSEMLPLVLLYHGPQRHRAFMVAKSSAIFGEVFLEVGWPVGKVGSIEARLGTLEALERALDERSFVLDQLPQTKAIRASIELQRHMLVATPWFGVDIEDLKYLDPLKGVRLYHVSKSLAYLHAPESRSAPRVMLSLGAPSGSAGDESSAIRGVLMLPPKSDAASFGEAEVHPWLELIANRELPWGITDQLDEATIDGVPLSVLRGDDRRLVRVIYGDVPAEDLATAITWLAGMEYGVVQVHRIVRSRLKEHEIKGATFDEYYVKSVREIEDHMGGMGYLSLAKARKSVMIPTELMPDPPRSSFSYYSSAHSSRAGSVGSSSSSFSSSSSDSSSWSSSPSSIGISSDSSSWSSSSSSSHSAYGSGGFGSGK